MQTDLSRSIVITQYYKIPFDNVSDEHSKKGPLTLIQLIIFFTEEHVCYRGRTEFACLSIMAQTTAESRQIKSVEQNFSFAIWICHGKVLDYSVQCFTNVQDRKPYFKGNVMMKWR
jgi:hypothetical protein